MFSKIFTFSNATLLVALSLSTIAAWYSIVGLTAIFASAVIPIIIMGSALELAKITTTVWLRKYWDRCTWIMKVYLVPAVIALALLTSMGIFGFLSKAHLDQGVMGGDSIAQVQILDEKIKTAKENIEANRKALKQMDEAVDQVMARSDSEKGAEKAVSIRRSQSKERVRLQNEITAEQIKIAKLNEERAPIASEVRKVEAEVGPIKYIAAFIYGDNPDANLLERAVRWVIILLVIVFDPLAIILVIAANQSKDWDKEIEDDRNAMAIIPPKEEDTRPFTEEEITALDGPTVEPKAVWPFPETKEEVKTKSYVANDFIEFPVQPITEIIPVQEVVESIPEEVVELEPEVIAEDNTPNYEGIKDPITGEWTQTGPSFEPKQAALYKKAGGDYVEFEGKSMHVRVLREMHPEFFLEEDHIKRTRNTFGTTFPKVSGSGDVFTRVDSIPNRVYKYNGVRWIETPRGSTDSYLNDNYLQFLVDKISSGEYDPELLTPNEQDALEKYINGQKT